MSNAMRSYLVILVDMLSAFLKLQIMMQRSPLIGKFIRALGKQLSKDTTGILKSKIATVGHLGNHGRLISLEPFVTETI